MKFTLQEKIELSTIASTDPLIHEDIELAKEKTPITDNTIL